MLSQFNLYYTDYVSQFNPCYTDYVSQFNLCYTQSMRVTTTKELHWPGLHVLYTVVEQVGYTS